jgi:hypothetical protein
MPESALFDTSELEALVGREGRLGGIGRAKVAVVRRLRADHVSTLHITCSDGLEQKAMKAYHDTVVRDLTQAGERDWAPLRTANLGARYEWASGPVAFSHFRGEGSSVALIKINTHVGVERGGSQPAFGFFDRGGRRSATCGALSMLLAGRDEPFIHELEELFGSGGIDRLALLRDPEVTPPELAALFAAVLQARLQARRALLDNVETANDGLPGPDRLLIVASVTINQKGTDHELLVGFYAGERNAKGRLVMTWCGLSDDPRDLVYASHHHGVHITAEHQGTRRARGAYDHRSLIADGYHERETPCLSDQAAAALETLHTKLNDPAHPWTSLAIKGSALALGELLPIPALLALFAGGALEVNHAFKLSRIAHGHAKPHEVEALLFAAADDLASSDPEEARKTLEAATQRLRGLECPAT